MKRWQVLSPSATVGREISVEEAGLCTFCNRPWKDGDTWVALAQYEGYSSCGGPTKTVHDGCVAGLQATAERMG